MGLTNYVIQLYNNKDSYFFLKKLFINMKYFLFILFFCASNITFSQEPYIFFTQKQHEEIRKNLNDYKILIKEHKIQTEEFEKFKQEFELCKQLRNAQKLEFDELKNENLALKNKLIYNDNLFNENAELKKKILRLEKDYKSKHELMVKYKYKYETELNKSLGDRIIAGTVGGLFISCTLIAIYTSWEANYR